jgi:hypothetical protein
MEPSDLQAINPGRQTNIFSYLAPHPQKPNLTRRTSDVRDMPQQLQKLAAPIQKKIQKVADILVPTQTELLQIEETKSISNGSTGDTPEQL